MLQQPLLDVKATRISGKAAVMPDDTMTGNDDSYRIAIVRHADCSAAAGLADHDGDVFIAARFTSRDGLQRLSEGCWQPPASEGLAG